MFLKICNGKNRVIDTGMRKKKPKIEFTRNLRSRAAYLYSSGLSRTIVYTIKNIPDN